MSDSEWSKIDFQQFVKEFGVEILINKAPTILYSKKDKEHEAYNSIIAFFFIAGGLLIYIALTYFVSPFYFNLPVFIIIVLIGAIIDIFLIINYLKTNIYIKPIECWLEVYKGKIENNYGYFCFVYYPVFSGKCHPNAAKNMIYKLYQEEVLQSKIHISQIEVYARMNLQEKEIQEDIGFFFQYGEGNSFNYENIDHSSWKFFPYYKYEDDNFLAIANWDHQFEWRDDLEYDFDKLHEYAPWVIQRWNYHNLKPLSDDFKEEINWGIRNIESIPKLKPWEGNLENQTYINPNASKEESLIKEVIVNIIGQEKDLKRIRDVKDKLLSVKSYFRDLKI
ncbi:MAG: hypothetical protein ACFFA0_09600 [Promethearchaeota archaeon]